MKRAKLLFTNIKYIFAVIIIFAFPVLIIFWQQIGAPYSAPDLILFALYLLMSLYIITFAIYRQRNAIFIIYAKGEKAYCFKPFNFRAFGSFELSLLDIKVYLFKDEELNCFTVEQACVYLQLHRECRNIFCRVEIGREEIPPTAFSTVSEIRKFVKSLMIHARL